MIIGLPHSDSGNFVVDRRRGSPKGVGSLFLRVAGWYVSLEMGII